MQNLLKKCRHIVGFFKRSEVGNRLLTEKQKQLGHTQVYKLNVMEVYKFKRCIFLQYIWFFRKSPENRKYSTLKLLY